MTKRFLIILIALSLQLMFVQSVFGQNPQLSCEILPKLYNFQDFVTTKSFYLAFNFTNSGNEIISNGSVNVQILDPNDETIESYYSFSFPMNKTNPKEFFYFEYMWPQNQSNFALFELDKPGTWEIRANIISEQNIEVLSEGIHRINMCKKLLSVEELSQYNSDKIQENLALKTKIASDTLIFLTIVLIVLTFATVVVEPTWKWYHRLLTIILISIFIYFMRFIFINP